MAIVKMKKLRLLGLRADRERLLRPLQSLGCVAIREPAIDLSDPEWSALAKPEGAGLAKAREDAAQQAERLLAEARSQADALVAEARQKAAREGETLAAQAAARMDAAATLIVERIVGAK